MKALQKEDVNAEFRFWGGDLMQGVSNLLVKHYKDLAFMGFLEVLMNLRTISKNLSFCKKDIEQYQPDVIIFIDYPGFNLRIAKWAKQKGFKTHYYISPQIWAWKENRINDIKRDVDKMYVILPFEKTFYEKKHAYPVAFVGHPLIDAISDRIQVDEYAFRAEHELSEKPIIALLPGSRKQEIRKMLTVMLSLIDAYPKYQFVITSGTATLETAIFKIPQVVCYKGSWLSYQIGKQLVKLKYISLVNLIMDKEVVKELIQNEFNTKNLKKALDTILDPSERSKIFVNYYELEKALGGKGASEKTAKLIFQAIQA